MTVEFSKGVDNINADTLSRLPPCEQCLIFYGTPMKKRNVKIYQEPILRLRKNSE